MFDSLFEVPRNFCHCPIYSLCSFPLCRIAGLSSELAGTSSLTCGQGKRYG